MSMNWSKELDAKAEFAEYYPQPEDAESLEGGWPLWKIALNAVISLVVWVLLLGGIIWLAESIEGWLR
jgi:hypothetical protein